MMLDAKRAVTATSGIVRRVLCRHDQRDIPPRAVTATSGIVRRLAGAGLAGRGGPARSHRDFRNREAAHGLVRIGLGELDAQSPRLQES